MMGDRPWASAYDPYFIQTEFEVIQSEVILGKVIEDRTLDLNRVWGRKYANGEPLKTHETMMLLKGRMDLRPVRNTSLIEIRIFSESPKEAAEIANAVAKAYKEHRLEQRLAMSRGGIKALEERWTELEKKINEAQKKVDDLREQLQIPDAVVNESAPTVLMSAESLRKTESLRLESKAQLAKEETILAGLKNKPQEDL